MGQPTPQTLGSAIRQACQSAGITQKQIAAAVERDQSTVSAWLNGDNWAPLATLPIIDELCGKPKGHILRLAGYVDDLGNDVEAAIAQDVRVRDDAKSSLLDIYRSYVNHFPADIDSRLEQVLDKVEDRTRRRRPQPNHVPDEDVPR
jgi:transcriptional regulator with XRE-family HTH domain